MEVAEVGTTGRKSVTRLLLRHKCLLFLFFVLCLPCVRVMVNQSLEMVRLWNMLCARAVG